MATYILTTTCIDGGKFGYNDVLVFTDKKTAIATTRHLCKTQQSFWVGSLPKVLFKGTIGYDIELSHPERDYTKVYSLRMVK